MNDPREDFWPDEIIEPADPAPVSLLKEQAALLGRKTKGEVEGEVSMYVEGDTAYYSLSIKDPLSGNYHYKLLDISHPFIGQAADYPIQAQSAQGGPPIPLADDDEFRRWLRAELSSDYVRSAIGNMVRYAREWRSHRV